jgi:hypothetical protein
MLYVTRYQKTLIAYRNIRKTKTINTITHSHIQGSRSQWPRGLRRRSAAERLLGSWVRISPGAWIFFLLYSVCVIRYRSLRRADPSSRGVPPNVAFVWVWSSENKQPRHLLWVGRRGKDYETYWEKDYQTDKKTILTFNKLRISCDVYVFIVLTTVCIL